MKAKLVSESLNEHINVHLNEGLGDIVTKYSGKIKQLIKSVAANFSPEKLRAMSKELAPFKGMSYGQIKNELEKRMATNEGKAMNIAGLTIFSTFATSMATIIADSKWDFLHKVFNIHDVGGPVGMTALVSFCAFVLWFWIKVDSDEPSYSEATRPSGVSSAERSSSSYKANQARQAERNAGR